MAAAGHNVIGVDTNETFVNAINEGRAPVDEPRLQELIDHSRDRLRASMDLRTAAARADFVFIIVPTPSLPSGCFSNDYILRCLPPIAEAITDGSHPHVVVTCTVSPRAMDTVIIPELERQSGRCHGVGFDISYNPHFIALGRVVRNMLRPDFVLIGHNVPDGGAALRDFYVRLYLDLGEQVPRMAVMNNINAEVSKLALNCYVTQKISYANSLRDLSEKLPGADSPGV